MKSLRFLITAVIFFSLVLGGCNLTEKNEYTEKPGDVDKSVTTEEKQPEAKTLEGMTYAPDRSSVTQVDYKQPELNFNTQDKRVIIRTGTMSVEVERYDESAATISDIVKNFGGYVTNSSSTLNASGKKQGNITIRVAADKYDAMIAELSKVGKVMNENISGKDVTEEYMDAEARLKTQRELEARLLKLLEEKTAKLTDIVDVEQKLASVRENIEKTEGRLRYLKDQSAYSTLTVSVYEPAMLVTSTGGGFFYEIEQSFKKGLAGFTKVLTAMITAVIALVPVILLLGIVYYIVRKALKRRKLAKA